MKYNMIIFLVALALLIGFTSCNTDDPVSELLGTEHTLPPANPDAPDDNDAPDDSNPMMNKLKISIGTTSFNVTLEDNAIVNTFKALLPITIDMSEMNGNEKYYYLPENLPTASFNPGTIRTGDLMLYGSSCLVLFYKTVSTSYSYTRLGRMDNPSELESALGIGNAMVTFELQ